MRLSNPKEKKKNIDTLIESLKDQFLIEQKSVTKAAL